MFRIFIFLLFISSTTLSAQTIIAQENFTNYQATTMSVPAGWHFTYQGSYTSTSFSGSSGPNSYKFGTNNATITAPKFNNADSVKFWIKGSGVDTISKLVIFESADSTVWDTLVKIDHLPTTAAKGKRSFGVKSTSKFLKFKYVKSAGNLAFDDFKLVLNASNINFTSDSLSSCSPFCSQFTATSITKIKSYQWDLGVGVSNLEQPTQCFSTMGDYTVSLTVIDSLDNIYTLSKPNYISIYPVPVAEYTIPTSVDVNTVVNFTDASTGASNWAWNFFDPNDTLVSILQNPTHTFTDTGKYCPTLIIYTNHGCYDTVQHCLQINSLLTSISTNSKTDLRFTAIQNDNSLQLNFLEPLNKTAQMNMYNSAGLLIKKINLEETSIADITTINAGIYFIEVISEDRREVQKIIVF